MRLFLPLFLSLGLVANAATELISLTISVTNATGTIEGDSLTIDGSTRTFTNDVSGSPGTLIATNTRTGSATNLYLSASAYRWGYLNVQYADSNAVKFMALPGDTIAFSISGTWGEGALVTNTAGGEIAVTVPISGETVGNRTNIASDLVTSMSQWSTNAFQPAQSAVSNLVQTTTDQTIAGTKTFTGAISGNVSNMTNGSWRGAVITNATMIGGAVSYLTNGYWTNAVLVSPTTTNLVNRGNAVSSPGTGVHSEQFGTGSTATGDYSLAVGDTAEGSGDYTLAIGTAAVADTYASISIGYAALTMDGGTSITIGTGSENTGSNSIILGAVSELAGSNSIAIGNGIISAANNSVYIGNSGQTVYVPGIQSGTTQTNSTFKGTNLVNGDWSWQLNAVSTIAAGNNVVDPAEDKTYLYLSGTPGAAFAICALDDGRNGRFLIIENGTGYNMTIAHESGFTATAADRIYTPTSADVTVTGRDTAIFVYNSTVSRWILITPHGNVPNAAAQVVGAGTDFALTNYYQAVDFGTTDPAITLPAAGTYQISYWVVWDTGATVGDVFRFGLHNTSNDVDLPGSWSKVSNLVADSLQQVGRSAIYTATNAAVIALWGMNDAATRGSVYSTNTVINYVRLQ